MYELVQRTSMPRPDWVDQMGTFNTIPLPFCLSTETEFQNCLTCYNPKYLEFRQVRLVGEDNKPQSRDVHIFWFHSKAFMMVHPIPSSPNTQYYRIGCVHTWKDATEEEVRSILGRPLNNCEHLQICSSCRSLNHTDSSD